MQYYFDVSAGSDSSVANNFYLKDLQSDATLYSLTQLIIPEGPSVVLVTTKFVDSFEEWNENIKSWGVINMTTVFVPIDQLLDVDVKVVARLECSQPSTRRTFVFSN